MSDVNKQRRVEWWATGLNLGAIVVLLYIAIGITCEITTRNEDYGRVAAYQKWLLACVTNPAADKTCPFDPGEDIKGRIDGAARQVRLYNSLNSIGALDRCSIAAVFAAPLGGFSEDCVKVMSAAPAVLYPRAQTGQPVPTTLEIAAVLSLQNKDQLLIYREILTPGLLTYSGWLALDQRAKEPLYFCLVLVASVIGSLIAGLRIDGITTLRDIALGLGAGFAVYILMRSGTFVFVTGDSPQVDIMNPFTAGAVGFLVGLFKDRAFGLLDGVVRQPAPPPGTPTAGTPADGAAKVAATATLAAARIALEDASAKAKAGAADAPQALADALAAFKHAEDQLARN